MKFIQVSAPNWTHIRTIKIYQCYEHKRTVVPDYESKTTSLRELPVTFSLWRQCFWLEFGVLPPHYGQRSILNPCCWLIIDKVNWLTLAWPSLPAGSRRDAQSVLQHALNSLPRAATRSHWGIRYQHTFKTIWWTQLCQMMKHTRNINADEMEWIKIEKFAFIIGWCLSVYGSYI